MNTTIYTEEYDEIKVEVDFTYSPAEYEGIDLFSGEEIEINSVVDEKGNVIVLTKDQEKDVMESIGSYLDKNGCKRSRHFARVY